MGRRRIFELLSVFAFLVGAQACSGQGGTAGQSDPGSAVSPKPSGERQEELNRVNQALSDVAGLDAAAFSQRYAVPFSSELGYDPLASAGLETIQGSSLALNDAERQALADGGFVITERKRFPTFTYGYQTLYLEDLPLYVSADSILFALHQSYDSVLRSIELAALIPALDRFLGSMRQELGAGKVASGTQVSRDVDLYLTVALSLLRGSSVVPVSGGDAKDISVLVASANRASGTSDLDLFGVPRKIDFSQFEPRGHYTLTEALKRYFRAMIWLGRIDLRLIETQSDHSQVFHRRQLEAALALRALIDAAALRDFEVIDRTVSAFVGEPDSMTLPQVDALLADLGISEASALAQLSDEQIAQAIVDGGYGTQRISSHIMINGLGEGTMPLSSSFLLFGQRYVIDSHVFSNVVYDRVQKGAVYRMMPNPLDVGFAALGNDHAGQLLLPELDHYRYAPDLASMRVLVDAHGSDYLAAKSLQLVARSAARAFADAGDRGSRCRGPPARRGERALGPSRARHAARFVGGAPPRHASLRQAVLHRRRELRVSGCLRRPVPGVLRADRRARSSREGVGRAARSLG